jgi:ribulose-5-phosphate 4-epimerase/fuculose-1-phosphate aldolase
MQDSEIRKKLVTTYKILHYLALDDHTYTHISARSQDGSSFFIYPFGFRFEEVSEDSLMKISLAGEVLEGKEYQYNQTGYMIHQTVYRSRKDLNAIIHIHTPEIVAVSCCEKGLMPLSQWALHFYNKVSYHAYSSLVLQEDLAEKMAEDLGQNRVMLLQNHGSVTCGSTLHEALFYTYHLQLACKTQCLALAMNHPLIVPSKETSEKAVVDLLSFEPDLGIRDWVAWERLVLKQY